VRANFTDRVKILQRRIFMATILTETGWEDAGGNLLGKWTNEGDRVGREDEVRVAIDVTVDTLAGDDYILGDSEFDLVGIAISNRGTIDTGKGNDFVSGNLKSTSIATGISNIGTIDTGKGSDIVSGIAFEGLGGTKRGIRNFGTIDTGKGNDIVRGIVRGANTIGIDNFATIDTGEGSDLITGSASGTSFSIGIRNFSNGKIETGDGNDVLMGIGSAFGIANEGGTINTGDDNDYLIGIVTGELGGFKRAIRNTKTIKTGDGDDIVDALTGGFGSLGILIGTIDLGKGDDLIRGFGEQIVDGGKDFDTAELGIDYDQSLFSLGSSFDIKIGDMTFTNVERFVFNDVAYSLLELQNQTTITV
jgi:hypothetical protein